MPHQSSSSSHLYDQDRGKANARTVEYYVTVMTDATHELIVIRADDNLNSRDWIWGTVAMIRWSSSSMHVNGMELSVNTHTYIVKGKF